MRIIVFGGTGLIGRALLGAAGMRAHELWVVTRNPGAASPVKDVQFISYDRDDLASLFKGEYGLVNLTGARLGPRPWTKKRMKVILESRLWVGNLISDLVNSITDKPRYIIQASAAGYYGSRGEERLTEETSKGSGFLPDVTDQWEQSIHLLPGTSTRVVYLRTGLVLSGEGGFLGPVLPFFRLYLGGHFGNGEQWMPWIHMEDEIGAIRHLMEHPDAAGVYNLSAPEPVRGKMFFSSLGRVLHRPSWLHVPAVILKAIPHGFGKELLLTSQQMVPLKLLEQGYAFKYGELEKALTNLFQS